MWFRCLIRGENFPGELAGQEEPVGFYTTCFVEADTSEAAEKAALILLREEPKLANTRPQRDTQAAKVFFDEIERIVFESIPATNPGFAFYSMADE